MAEALKDPLKVVTNEIEAPQSALDELSNNNGDEKHE